VVTAVNCNDVQLVQLLLSAGASPEHNSGQAILCAATLGFVNVLKALVEGKHCAKPSAMILTSGLRGAMTLNNTDAKCYFQIVQILLEAGARGEVMDVILLEAVKEGDSNLEFSKLLYKHGASPEWNNGEALDTAVKSNSVATVTLFLETKLGQAVLERAYNSASALSKEQRYEVLELLLNAGKSIDSQVAKTLTDVTRETPPDRRLIKLLLVHGAFDHGQAMAHAASVLDFDSLTLLVENPKSQGYISAAFEEAMKTDLLWQSREGYLIVELMLQNGATGGPVGAALFHAIKESQAGKEGLAEEFLNLLLKFGADVNYERGLALQHAAAGIHLDLLRKLLPRAIIDSKAMAIPHIFKTDGELTDVLDALELFHTSLADSDKDYFYNFKHPDPIFEHALFNALDRYPRKPKVLKALLDLGYKPNQWQLYEREYEVGPEPWPVLCWALDQPEKKISNSNIELLINEGGKWKIVRDN
jgi:ankyrin repeat protein